MKHPSLATVGDRPKKSKNPPPDVVPPRWLEAVAPLWRFAARPWREKMDWLEWLKTWKNIPKRSMVVAGLLLLLSSLSSSLKCLKFWNHQPSVPFWKIPFSNTSSSCDTFNSCSKNCSRRSTSCSSLDHTLEVETGRNLTGAHINGVSWFP